MVSGALGYEVGISEFASLAERRRQLRYKFGSAWSPPIPIIEALSRAYPTLQFTLKFRDFLNCRGRHVLKAGKVVLSEYKEI